MSFSGIFGGARYDSRILEPEIDRLRRELREARLEINDLRNALGPSYLPLMPSSPKGCG